MPFFLVSSVLDEHNSCSFWFHNTFHLLKTAWITFITNGGGGGGRRQALIINLNFCYFLTKGKQHRWVYYKRSSKHFQQRQFGIFTSHNKVPRIKSQLHSVSASWGCVPWEMVGNVLVPQSLLSPGKACMNSLACWDFSCWRHLENR